MFIPVTNDVWKKMFWSIKFYMEIHCTCWDVCENFSFGEVSCEHVIVTWLKDFSWANIIAPSTFFAGDAQVPVYDKTYPFIAYPLTKTFMVLAVSAMMYCNDSILFENDVLDGVTLSKLCLFFWSTCTTLWEGLLVFSFQVESRVNFINYFKGKRVTRVNDFFFLQTKRIDFLHLILIWV